MTRLIPLLVAGAALAACTPAAPVTPAVGPPAPAVVAGPLPEMSLYQVDAPWTTHRGDTVSLASFRGAPVLVAMVYATCHSACPMIVRDMRAMADALGDDARGLRYVLVSLDPERDTPEALAGFARMYQLDDAWTLLSGTPDDVQTLAHLLDVRYRPEPDGQIAHTNAITVLDADGAVAARQEGLGTDARAAVGVLGRLLGAS